MTASPTFVDGCDFCKLAQGRDQSAEVLAEGDEWVAFFPLDPATPGHTLIIPRSHVVNLWEIDSKLGCVLMDAVVAVGRGIQTALRPDGMNLITSAGSVAEQTIFHLHLHLVPRWQDDCFGQIWPTESKGDRGDLEQVAIRIRAALATIG